MEPRIQYAKTSDGVNIAYATAGKGRTVIALPSPPLSHAQRLPLVLPRLFEGYADRFRAVWYDSRGSGLSDRDAIDFSMPAMVRDLEAVADSVPEGELVLSAAYDGVPIAISYAAVRPERVSHLILVDGWLKSSDYFFNPAIHAEEALRQQDWLLYTETLAKVLIGYEDSVFAAAFGEHIRACVEPEALRAAYSSQQSGDWDVADLVRQIRTHALVLHNRGNRFLPVRVGQRLAAAILGARFLEVDDQLYEDVPRLIEDFISETAVAEVAPSQLPSGTAVILFADIADSTSLTERMGDAAFREKARELDEALRNAITSNGGQAIDGKLLGDGVLATFGSAKEAIACAGAVHEAGRHAGLPLHVGVHAGDVIREQNNVFGGAVNIAARVAGEAAAGETLVSQTVRELARTSAGVSFEDRGERELKGVGEPVRVYEVRWRENE